MAHTEPETLPSIIIVDDEPHLAEGMRHILAAEGFSIEIASTGQEGLALIAERDPDLVLLDVVLPDTSGTEICQQMRSSGSTAKIMLLSSARIEPEDQAAGLALGADDYIRRPYSRVEFVARVHTLLRARQVEEALRSSRSQLEKIISNMADGVLVIDQQGKIQFANEAAASMFARPVTDLIGRPFGYPVVNTQFAEVDIYRRGHNAGVAEMRVTKIRWHEEPASLITMRDITRQKQTNDQLRRLSTALESAPYGVMITNAVGLVEWANPAFTRLTGYTYAEAIGKPPRDLFARPEDIAVGNEIHTAMIGKLAWEGQVVSQRKDSTQFIQQMIIAPVTNEMGKATHFVSIMHDITAEKHAEAREAREKEFALALARNTAIITSAVGNIDRTLDLILDSVGDFIPHTGANILLREADSGLYRIARICDCYQQNGVAEPKVGDLLNLEEWSVMQAVLIHGEARIISDVRDHPEWVENGDLSWIRSYAVAPIRVRNQLIGVLNVDHAEPAQYTEEHLPRLQAFADQAAIAIANAQLYEQLEEQIRTLESAVERRTRELLEAKERVERTLNNSPDPILLLDAQGLIETSNSAFHEVFGYNQQEIIGKDMHFLMTGESHIGLDEMLADAAIVPDAIRRQLVARRADQSLLDVDVAFSSIVESSIVFGFVCTIRDISETKELERLKDQFVSNVSHELRTPLTNIQLNHKLLSLDPGNQARYLDRLERESNRLHTLIEDLLSLSRIDQNRMTVKREPVQINRIIETFVHDRTALVEASNRVIRFQPAPDLPLIQADPRLIEQILSILITNAISYSPAESEIVISTAPITETGTAWVSFSVKDHGYGIPPEELPRLFTRFYRGWAAQQTNASGTGLGLAIASEIVGLHGGRITASSKWGEDQGSIFTVLLPIEKN